MEVIRRLLSKPPSTPEPAAPEQRLEARGPAVQSSPAAAESTPEPTFVETDLSADPPDLEPHAADGESNRWRLAAIAATVVGTVVLVAALLNFPSGGVPDRGSTEPPAAAAPAPQAAPAKREVDVSRAGTLTGRVLFEGPVPGTPPVRMSADPVCIRVNPDGRITEEFAVSDGGLENVFVYIKSGLDPYEFTLPTRPVTVEMKGCGYVPHVFGVRAGQPIEFANGDPTLHAVHARPNVNAEFAFGHPIQGMRTEQTFTSPEVPVTITCDVHSWEKAYAGVVAHPYFAVTSGGGRFELKDVPAGTYTIEAVHEKLGSQTQSVTFGERDTKEVVFTFKSPS